MARVDQRFIYSLTDSLEELRRKVDELDAPAVGNVPFNVSTPAGGERRAVVIGCTKSSTGDMTYVIQFADSSATTTRTSYGGAIEHGVRADRIALDPNSPPNHNRLSAMAVLERLLKQVDDSGLTRREFFRNLIREYRESKGRKCCTSALMPLRQHGSSAASDDDDNEVPYKALVKLVLGDLSVQKPVGPTQKAAAPLLPSTSRFIQREEETRAAERIFYVGEEPCSKHALSVEACVRALGAKFFEKSDKILVTPTPESMFNTRFEFVDVLADELESWVRGHMPAATSEFLIRPAVRGCRVKRLA
jgi:hypothetical protein